MGFAVIFLSLPSLLYLHNCSLSLKPCMLANLLGIIKECYSVNFADILVINKRNETKWNKLRGKTIIVVHIADMMEQIKNPEMRVV